MYAQLFHQRRAGESTLGSVPILWSRVGGFPEAAGRLAEPEQPGGPRRRVTSTRVTGRMELMVNSRISLSEAIWQCRFAVPICNLDLQCRFAMPSRRFF